MSQRKYLGQNCANISAPFGIFCHRNAREWRGQRSKLPTEQIEQNVATVIARRPICQSPNSSPQMCHHYLQITITSHSGQKMTHLSAGLRFFSGTHLSIETSVSVPPWPAHHCCMLSPRKETVQDVHPPRSSAHRQHRWDKAGGSQLERSREGRFLGGAPSPLLCSACWRRLCS